MNEEKKKATHVLRSLVMSSPHKGKPLRELAKDYYECEGRKIPIFEHRSVEDFLKSTGEFIIENRGGELKIYEKPNSGSSHISLLIEQQKKNKKRPASANRFRPTGFQSNLPLRRPELTNRRYPAYPSRAPTKSIFPKPNVINPTRNVPAHHRQPTMEFTCGQLNSQQNAFDQKIQPKQDLRQKINQLRGRAMETIDLTVDDHPTVPAHRKPDNQSVPISPKKYENQKSTNGLPTLLPNNPFFDTSNPPPNLPPNRLQERLQRAPKPDSHAHTIVNKNVVVNSERKSVNDRLATARQNPPANDPNQTNHVIKQANGHSAENTKTTIKSVTPQLSPVSNTCETLLFDYCKQNDMSVPKFKLFRMDNRFQCHVTIDKITYSSYPTDYSDENEARRETSKYALDRLMSIQEHQKFEICLDNEAELARKIYECIQDYKTGVFSKNIPEKFVSQYKQVLPTGWMDILAKHPECFTLEECIQDHIVYVVEAAELEIKMDTLQLPWDEEYWSMIITCPISTDKVFGRLIGKDHSNALDSLVNDIELDLLKNKQIPKTFNVGHIYLVLVNECAYRVRVDKVDEERQQCLCFGIDEGDQQWYEMKEMYVCQNKFLKLAPQAIRIALHGMEDFDDNAFANQHLEETLLNSPPLIAQIFTKKSEFIELIESSDSEPVIQAVLYDTSTPDDINLNELMVEKICADIPAPELRYQELTRVIVSHISDDGDIYIQLGENGVHYINKLIHKITQSNHSNQTLPATNRFNNNMFLVFDDETHKWCRGRFVSDVKDKMTGEIFFVDYGKTKTVSLTKIHRLDTMSQALLTFPPQAVQVKLQEFNVPKHRVSNLRGYFSGETTAYVMRMNVTGNPEVRLYYLKDSIMTNVKDCIEAELNHPQANEASLSRQSSTTSTTSLGSCGQDVLSNLSNLTINSRKLPKFQPPEVNDYFDVEVVMTPSPSNFVIRPIKYMRQWVQQMKSLQDYCNRSRDNVTIDAIRIDETYACLKSDGKWYRATILQSTKPKFMIHFCDVGDIDIIDNISSIKVLPDEYRALPKLAIKATLYGIESKYASGWDMDDIIHFGRCVTGKKYQAIVNKITVDETTDDNDVLAIQLIDVSNDFIDVCINDQLVSDDVNEDLKQ